MMQDYRLAARFARAVLRDDPNDMLASEVVEKYLSETKQFKEAHELARERCEKVPTARNHYLHARNLIDDRQEKEAEKILCAGMKRWPEDALCPVCLAALLLRTSDSAKTLKEVDELLDLVQSLMRPDGSGELLVEIDFLRAVYDALTGDVLMGRLRLMRMQTEDPTSERLNKALAAFSK
jgi:hypothetical protein